MELTLTAAEGGDVMAPDADRSAERAGTIVDLVVRRARETPGALAYTFLADGRVEAGRLTYAELDVAARAVAAGLLAVARPGDRALLVYEAGLDFVAALFGCLYAGIVAVPVPAPEASRVGASLPRLASVAADSGAHLLLGNARTHALLRDGRADVAAIKPEGWIDTREMADAAGAPALDALPSLASDRRALAYLQYTSGSTSTPKGVMVGHGDLVDHLEAMRRSLGYDDESVSVSWMPHFHDYGLIEGVLLPPYNGTPAYLLAPFAFLKRPADWLGAIGRYRGTHTQGPNFAYRYAARRVTPDQRRAIDLGTLRSAGNGAEPIHPETSAAFHAAFAECGLRMEALRPVFGLAEATLLVTSTPMDEAPKVGRFSAAALGRGVAEPATDPADVVEVVGCGVPLYRTHVAIVDPDARVALGEDRVGEVWSSAPGTAQGYWERPEESEETFRARLAGGSADACARRYLRTGDLGFVHGGQLYITARMKDLIIIRGLNHYPQDVEWTVQGVDPALRADNGAAFAVQVDGEERLCVVQELERAAYSETELEELAGRAATAVAEAHGAALHALVLIRRGSLAKTSSGKVQRRATRSAFLDGTLEALHHWAPVGVPRALGTAPAAPPAAPAEDPEVARSRDAADALIAWLRDYAEHRLNLRLMDERRSVPPNVVLDLGNRGVFGLQAPRRYGGLELRHADALRVLEQLGAIDLTLATLVFLHNTNGVLPVLHFAPDALRDELLPVLAAGRELAAFALSEPGAGSNLGAVDARAAADGADAWTLHGTKRWNGSAWAGVVTVFARAVDAAGRPRGFTAFVLRQGEPGLRMGPEALTMGVRSIMQNSMTLDGARVTRGRMLGTAGHGMRIVDFVLSHGRLAAAAISVGAMRRCAQLLLRYASRRRIETGLLLEHPHVAARASALAHRVAVEHAGLAACAAAMDAGAPLVSEVAMALKVSATEALGFAADLLVQTLGGRGYMENNLAPQLFRDARMLRIGEGANEGLTAAVGRGLRLGEALPAYLAAHDAGGTTAARVADLTARLARLTPPAANGSRPDEAAFGAARDMLLGRLATAALGVLAAEAPSRGDPAAAAVPAAATRAWARREFEAVCAEAEQFPSHDAALLSTDQLREAFAGYAAVIGDVEPLAADVEWELDPLLRRTGPTGDR